MDFNAIASKIMMSFKPTNTLMRFVFDNQIEFVQETTC